MTEQVHGHEDLGNVILYSGDRRLIDDAGLYAYFGGPERGKIVSHSSHNVIQIDGADYHRSARGDLTSSILDDRFTFANMRTRVWSGATWSRTLLAIPEIPVIVVDDRISQGTERPVSQRWHVGVDSTVTIDGTTATVTDHSGSAGLEFHFLGEPSPEVSSATSMRSVRYRELTEVPLIDATHNGPKRFTTVIGLGDTEARLISRTTDGFRIEGTTAGVNWRAAVERATDGSGVSVKIGD